MKSGGYASVLGMGSAGILSAIKDYNFMEFPFIFGFLHLLLALVGILLITNKFKNFKGFFTGGYLPAIMLWTILIIVPTQLPFIFMSLATFRMLMYIDIPIAIFASIGLKKILELTKSTASKAILCITIIIYVFFAPLAYNIYAMNPAISSEEKTVLNCASEKILAEDSVFVAWDPIIYFSDITNKKVAFDDPVKYYEIIELLESYNVSGARDEIINMNLKYVYINRKSIAILFGELEGVEEICSSKNYYLFRIVNS